MAHFPRYRPTDPFTVRSGNSFDCDFPGPGAPKNVMQFYVIKLSRQGHFGPNPEFLCVFWLTVVKHSRMHLFLLALCVPSAPFRRPGDSRNALLWLC